MPRRLLVHARYTVGTRLLMHRTARSLRHAAAAATTPGEVIRAAYQTADGPVDISPLQVRDELADFLALIATERPRRTLEIGTGRGGTLYLLAWASDPAASILSLDQRVYPAARRFLYRGFAAGRRRVEVMEADSHLDETRARVERFFGDESLDLLLIDGDHGYESVRRDHELYGPLVRDGGLIAFHDIVDGPLEAVGGVPRYWREVRGSLDDTVELVHDRAQGGYGIGIGRRVAAPGSRSRRTPTNSSRPSSSRY
jgi:predicted O-methyltransferase YrrM